MSVPATPSTPSPSQTPCKRRFLNCSPPGNDEALSLSESTQKKHLKDSIGKVDSDGSPPYDARTAKQLKDVVEAAFRAREPEILVMGHHDDLSPTRPLNLAKKYEGSSGKKGEEYIPPGQPHPTQTHSEDVVAAHASQSTAETVNSADATKTLSTPSGATADTPGAKAKAKAKARGKAKAKAQTKTSKQGNKKQCEPKPGAPGSKQTTLNFRASLQSSGDATASFHVSSGMPAQKGSES